MSELFAPDRGTTDVHRQRDWSFLFEHAHLLHLLAVVVVVSFLRHRLRLSFQVVHRKSTKEATKYVSIATAIGKTPRRRSKPCFTSDGSSRLETTVQASAETHFQRSYTKLGFPEWR